MAKWAKPLPNHIGELRNFDAQEEQKGIFGFFKKNAINLAAMKTKYEKAETNIENICKVLEGHQIQLMKDSAMLDQMYDMNQDYFKQLTMYIIAGKEAGTREKCGVAPDDGKGPGIGTQRRSQCSQ